MDEQRGQGVIADRRWAFTLIELLAVVAVLLLLMTLLAPMLGRAYQRAQLVRCTANLRQLYTLCVGFAQDNDRMLPQGLSENPRQLSARAGYTNFRLVEAYMKEMGLPPSLWYCPSFPRQERYGGDESAWGDANYYSSGRPGSTGTPGEFPIGYCYVGNMTRTSIHKYIEKPPDTLDDLLQRKGALVWDVCYARRPSPVEADAVRDWLIFPHFGVDNPSVCLSLMGNGSVQKKFISELIMRYHYIHPGELYW